MSLFSFFGRRNPREEKEEQKGGTFFKIIRTVSIVGIFLAIGLTVFATMGYLKFNSTTFGLIGTIGIICAGCWLMLPWLNYLERKQNKVVSIVFVGLIILTSALWLITLWALIIQVHKGTLGVGTFNFIRVVLIISLQFAVASFIAGTIVKYGKKLLFFQVIAYISYLYLDFYVSSLLFCFSIGGENGISFNLDLVSIVANKLCFTLFIISAIYVAIANSIVNKTFMRRNRSLGDVVLGNVVDQLEQPKQQKQQKEQNSETAEEQLTKLNSLLEKKLITQEEYDQKRKDILDKM